MSGDTTFVPVERGDVAVWFLRARIEPLAMQLAWKALEERVGLRGRTFLGAFYPATQEYRVCVRVREGDDPDALGLEAGVVPGGRYLRARLRGEPPGVYERIQPTFTAMLVEATSDPVRPSIELYRRHDEIDLLLPIAASPTSGSA